MAKVLVTKDKLDNLAEAISEKSAVATPLTIDQMTAAVQSITIGDTEINNQEKTVIPTEERQYITADSGYTGLDQVTIEPIDSGYVSSGVARKTSSDLSVVGDTITVPAGYYENAASTSVAAGSLRYSGWTETESNNRYIMTANKTFSPGYLSSAQDVVRMFTSVIDTTITPSTSQQVVERLDRNTFIKKVVIDPIPNNYIIPTGNKIITSNGTEIDVTNYATVTVNVPVDSTINNQNQSITPTKSQQSFFADNRYTGLETTTVNAIPAEYITTDDANAIAADILEDKIAYVDGSKITGELVVNKYYTGTTAPPTSLGNNGDIYLQQ